MKMLTMLCPYCNAQINVTTNPNTNYCYCTYCGSQILLDDGSTTFNYNYTYREINDANIAGVHSNERIRFREIEEESQENKRKHKFVYFYFIFLFVLLLMCFMPMLISDIKENNAIKSGMIKIPYSASHFTGENYIQVQNELSDLGFKNIEIFPMEDLKIGLLKKENDVDEISISGKTNFSAGELYGPNEPIKIYYHSYSESESESKNQKGKIENNKFAESQNVDNTSDNSEKESKNNITIPYSSSYYTGENYVQIQNELKDLGFTNIEVIPMEDLKIGLISKENDIDRISIGGKSKFEEEEFFESDAPIKIYYHSYPNKSE